MDREEQKPLEKYDLRKHFNNQFSKKYCSSPTKLKIPCEGNIIKAHTVSKSSSLKAISRDGLVYSFMPSIMNIVMPDDVIAKPKLYGIKKASTFTGFCRKHDNTIFLPIEDETFTVTKKTIFLLGYRSLARELYTKMAQRDSEPILRQADKGKTTEEQFVHQEELDMHYELVNAGIRDLENQKSKFDEILVNNNYNDIEGFVVEFGKIPNIMCSSGLTPEYDYSGIILQDLSDLNIYMSSLCLNIINSNNKGYVVFTWHKDSSEVCHRFIDSFRFYPESRITDAIIRLCFKIENIYLSPDWWESLPDNKQNKLILKLAASADPDSPEDNKSLVEDNIQYDNWNVVSKQYV